MRCDICGQLVDGPWKALLGDPYLHTNCAARVTAYLRGHAPGLYAFVVADIRNPGPKPLSERPFQLAHADGSVDVDPVNILPRDA